MLPSCPRASCCSHQSQRQNLYWSQLLENQVASAQYLPLSHRNKYQVISWEFAPQKLNHWVPKDECVPFCLGAACPPRTGLGARGGIWPPDSFLGMHEMGFAEVCSLLGTHPALLRCQQVTSNWTIVCIDIKWLGLICHAVVFWGRVVC